MQQRLYYLEQYTAGEPRNLVRRCFHLPPEQGYKEAMKQLQWHFGNEIKITSAFMDKALGWPAIKTEDASGLPSYAIFLKSWRGVVSNIYDRRKQRATFNDLLAFIDRHSRIMLDPIFGEILNPVNKAPMPRQSKVYLKSSKESGFATVVSPMQMYAQTKLHAQSSKQSSNAVSSSAFTKPYMFCNKNHPMEICETFQTKQNKEKVDFLKAKGMCFGCLQQGHMSKSCHNRLSCKICKQNHPIILTNQRKSKNMSN